MSVLSTRGQTKLACSPQTGPQSTQDRRPQTVVFVLGCGEASVEVCTQCPSASSLFLPTTESQRNFGVRSCVCDENFYGLVGTACTVCPSGQNRTGFVHKNTTLGDCECIPGYEPDPAAANLCRKCPIGIYKHEVGDHNCSLYTDTFTTEDTYKVGFQSEN